MLSTCDYINPLGLFHWHVDRSNTPIAKMCQNMVSILEDDNFKCIFLNESDRIPIPISLTFDPRSSVDNKPALVQVMAWHRTGDKPLPEPILAHFTDAYMRH